MKKNEFQIHRKKRFTQLPHEAVKKLYENAVQ